MRSTPADQPASTEPDHRRAAPEPRLHQLADGARVLIRPLVPGDRDELVTRYGELSSQSRRLRFVSAPAHLSDRLLDHLLDVDYLDRHALVATLFDEPGTQSVGIARYFRSPLDPTSADAAVTVLDAHQSRGIGTLLLNSLVAAAMGNGIETFTADILWDNSELLDVLRAAGASVMPGEPGIATVRVALPPIPEGLRGSPLHEVMRIAGAEPVPWTRSTGSEGSQVFELTGRREGSKGVMNPTLAPPTGAAEVVRDDPHRDLR